MIKGKAKIQLFDAKTGVQSNIVQSENMMTNAVSNLFNADMNAIMSTDFFPDMCRSITPFGEKLLSGVMLFDTLLTEDEDNIFVPAGVNEIGHAGSPYAGTSAFRGSMNENESGAIEGGYRWVWDFASDKANGTIKCISLTSRIGGNMGFHASTAGDEALLLNPCGIDNLNFNTSGINAAYGVGCYLGSFVKNKHIFGSVSGNVLTLSIYKATPRTAVKLYDTITANGADKLDLQVQLTSDFTELPNIKYSFVTEDGKLCFLWKSANVGKVNYVSIDLTTLSFTSQREITLSGAELTLQYPAFAEVNGFLYIPLDSTRVGKFTTEGVYVRDYAINASNAYSSVINGMIYYYSNNQYMSVINGNEICTVKRPVNMLAVYNKLARNVALEPPYIQSVYSDSGGYTIASNLYINALYLGTINNLAEPIIKTTNSTMKITYDIVNA